MYLEVKNATKRFERPGLEPFVALDDVSLGVEKGEFVCLLGPSGCGKTTLLNVAAGFEKLTSGKMTLDGAPIQGPSLRRATVFQNYGLLPWRSALKNVELGLESQKIPAKMRREIAEKYLKLVGMEDFAKRRPAQLSGGQQQRIGVARALAIRPDVLLMDEPFGALDPAARRRLQNDLRNILSEEKCSILFVTHDVDEAIFLADRVVVMEPNPGRIRKTISIGLSFPRVRADVAFQDYRRKIYRELFTSDEREIEYYI